jgi:hypothetical protein
MMSHESLDPRDAVRTPDTATHRAPAAEPMADREVPLTSSENPALWAAIDAETARRRTMRAPDGFAARVLAKLADR